LLNDLAAINDKVLIILNIAVLLVRKDRVYIYYFMYNVDLTSIYLLIKL